MMLEIETNVPNGGEKKTLPTFSLLFSFVEYQWRLVIFVFLIPSQIKIIGKKPKKKKNQKNSIQKEGSWMR